MKKLMLVVLVLGVLVAFGSTGALAKAYHARISLEPVGGSGVSGFAVLVESPHGTRVNVVARGLEPGETYLSLYYDADNGNCTLEAPPPADQIGTNYVANAYGVGHVSGWIDEGLDEIGSISVRYADSPWELQACGAMP